MNNQPQPWHSMVASQERHKLILFMYQALKQSNMMGNKSNEDIIKIAKNFESNSYQGASSKENYINNIKLQAAEIVKRGHMQNNMNLNNANNNNNGGNNNGNNTMNTNSSNNNNSNVSNNNNGMNMNNIPGNMNQMLAQQQLRNQMIAGMANNGQNANNIAMSMGSNQNSNPSMLPNNNASGFSNGNNNNGINNNNNNIGNNNPNNNNANKNSNINNSNGSNSANPNNKNGGLPPLTNAQQNMLYRQAQILAARMNIPPNITGMPNFPPIFVKWADLFDPNKKHLIPNNFAPLLKETFKNLCTIIIKNNPKLWQDALRVGQNSNNNTNTANTAVNPSPANNNNIGANNVQNNNVQNNMQTANRGMQMRNQIGNQIGNQMTNQSPNQMQGQIPNQNQMGGQTQAQNQFPQAMAQQKFAQAQQRSQSAAQQMAHQNLPQLGGVGQNMNQNINRASQPPQATQQSQPQPQQQAQQPQGQQDQQAQQQQSGNQMKSNFPTVSAPEYKKVLQKTYEEIQSLEKLGRIPKGTSTEQKILLAKKFTFEKLQKLSQQRMAQLQAMRKNAVGADSNTGTNTNTPTASTTSNANNEFINQPQSTNAGQPNNQSETVNPSNGVYNMKGGSINQLKVQERLQQQKEQAMNVSVANNSRNPSFSMVMSNSGPNNIGNASNANTPVQKPGTPMMQQQQLNSTGSPMLANTSPMVSGANMNLTFLPMANGAQNSNMSSMGMNAMNAMNNMAPNGVVNVNRGNNGNNNSANNNNNNNLNNIRTQLLFRFKNFSLQVASEMKKRPVNDITNSLSAQEKMALTDSFKEAATFVKQLDRIAFQFFAVYNLVEQAKRLLEIKCQLITCLENLKKGAFVMSMEDYGKLKRSIVQYYEFMKKRTAQGGNKQGLQASMMQQPLPQQQQQQQQQNQQQQQPVQMRTPQIAPNTINNVANGQNVQSQMDFNQMQSPMQQGTTLNAMSPQQAFQVPQSQQVMNQNPLVNNGAHTPQQLSMTPVPNPITSQIGNMNIGVPPGSIGQPPIGAPQFPPQMPTPQAMQGMPIQPFPNQGMGPGPAMGGAPAGFVQTPNGMLIPAQSMTPPNRLQPQPQPQPQPQIQPQQPKLQRQPSNPQLNTSAHVTVNNNVKKTVPNKKKAKQTPKISSPQPITKPIPKINTPAETVLTPTPSGGNFIANNNTALNKSKVKSPVVSNSAAGQSAASSAGPGTADSSSPKIGLAKEEVEAKNDFRLKEAAKNERLKSSASKPEKYLLSSLANLLELDNDFVDYNIDLLQSKDNEAASRSVQAEYEAKHGDSGNPIKTPKIVSSTTLMMSPKQSPDLVKGVDGNVINDGTAVSTDINFGEGDAQWQAKVHPQALRSKFKEVPSISDSLLPTMPTPPQDEKTVNSAKVGLKRLLEVEITGDAAAADGNDSKRVKTEPANIADGFGKKDVNDGFDFDSIFNFDGDEDVSNNNDEFLGMF